MSRRSRSFGSSALVEEVERPRELGLGGRDLRERVAADGGEVGDLGLLVAAPAGPSASRPRLAEHLGRLGDAAEPDQRPGLAAHRVALGPARRPRRERPAQRARRPRAPRRSGARRAAPCPSARSCSIRSSSAVRDARLEQHPLDAEPLGQPVEQLVRGHDLAPLDLAHVLLREPAGGELVLGHAGSPAQLADTRPERRRRPCLVPPAHHDPTAIPRSPNCLLSMDYRGVASSLTAA